MPSPNYEKYKPLFAQVFDPSCIESYRVPLTTSLVKLVHGVELTHIRPYLGSDKPYRGTFPGASGIFLVTDEKAASAEVLGSLGFANAPEDAVLLHYKFDGVALELDRVNDEAFQTLYHCASGSHRHEFAQDCRYYLDEHALTSTVDALVARSVSGALLGHEAKVYVVLPPYSGALSYQGFSRVEKGFRGGP